MTKIELKEIELENEVTLRKELSEKLASTNDPASKKTYADQIEVSDKKIMRLRQELKQMKGSAT